MVKKSEIDTNESNILKDPLKGYFSQIEVSIVRKKGSDILFWTNSYMRYLDSTFSLNSVTLIKLRQELKNHLVKKKNLNFFDEETWKELEKLF